MDLLHKKIRLKRISPNAQRLKTKGILFSIYSSQILIKYQGRKGRQNFLDLFGEKDTREENLTAGQDMIPLKDDNPTNTFPLITIVLIAINILVYVYQLTLSSEGLETFLFRYGAIPGRLIHPFRGSPIFSSNNSLRLDHLHVPCFFTGDWSICSEICFISGSLEKTWKTTWAM